MKLFVIKPDQKALDEAMSLLQHMPGETQKVAARAINRTVMAGRTVASRRVRDVYTVKASDVRASFFKSVKARSNWLRGELVSKGTALELAAFQHRPNKGDTTGSNRKTIFVTVKKEKTAPLATGFRYSNRIYQRIGKKHQGWNKNLEIPYSVSVPQMLGNANVAPDVQDRMQEAFERRLLHEVQFVLTKGKV